MKTYHYWAVMALLSIALCVFTALYGLNLQAAVFGACGLVLACYAITDYKESKR